MEREIDAERSEKARVEGNAAFKQGRWVKSIGHYTTAIVANPKEPLAYTNRAAAYLKLEKFMDAERDCSSALALQNGSVKALYRRAIARKSMDRLIEAQKDLQEVLKFEPSNETVTMELAEVKSLMKRKENLARAKAEANSNSARSPPNLTATIEEIQDAVVTEDAPTLPDPLPIPTPSSVPPAPSAPAPAPPTEPKASSFADLRKSRDAKKVYVGGSRSSSTESAKKRRSDTTTTTEAGSSAAPATAVPSDSKREATRSDIDTAQNGSQEAQTGHSELPLFRSAAAAVQTPTSTPTLPDEGKIASSQPASSSPSSTPIPTPTPTASPIPAPPRDPASTSSGAGLELLRRLSNLDPLSGWKYLNYYPSHVIPTIVSSLLEPDTLGHLLLALRRGVDDDAKKVRDVLAGLKSTKRWGMNVAMLSREERLAGAEAWTLSQGDGNWP